MYCKRRVELLWEICKIRVTFGDLSFFCIRDMIACDALLESYACAL